MNQGKQDEQLVCKIAKRSNKNLQKLKSQWFCSKTDFPRFKTPVFCPKFVDTLTNLQHWKNGWRFLAQNF